MDPDTTLAEIRDAIDAYDAARGEGNVKRMADAAEQLRDSIDALDAWMYRGGYLPEDWNWRG